MKKFNFELYEKNLPDCYDKTPVEQTAEGYTGSNNAKIFKLKADDMHCLKADIDAIVAWMDIDTAEGSTLDLIGKDVGQPRGVADDAQYRLMIKAKIAQNMCNGDLDSVLEVLSLILSCDPSELKIVDGEDPMTVVVENIPLAVITRAEFPPAGVVKIVENLMPSGVAVKEFEFTGTFEFCESEADMSTDGATKGFTDTEEHMDATLYPLESGYVGGTLGLFYDGNSAELPI